MDMEHPYPHEKPPFGVAGWTKDGKGVIVNHKYDLWLLALDGTKATNLTNGLGNKDEIRFRYVSIDPFENYIDTKKPILVSAYGEWTKKSGYYTITAGQNPKPLVFEERSFGSLQKAVNADRVVSLLKHLSISLISTPAQHRLLIAKRLQMPIHSKKTLLGENGS